MEPLPNHEEILLELLREAITYQRHSLNCLGSATVGSVDATPLPFPWTEGLSILQYMNAREYERIQAGFFPNTGSADYVAKSVDIIAGHKTMADFCGALRNAIQKKLEALSQNVPKTLNDNEYSVLLSLYDYWPRAILLDDLAAKALISRKSLPSILESLSKKGYAEQHSARRGWGITDKGREIIDDSNKESR